MIETFAELDATALFKQLLAVYCYTKKTMHTVTLVWSPSFDNIGKGIFAD